MRRFTVIVSLLAALAFAGFLGYKFWDEYGLWALAVYAAMILALPFQSLMHELGHMLFGAICKIKATPEFKLFGSSSCKLVPKTDEKLRVRVFFTALGGIVVNLLFFLLGNLALSVDAMPSWLALFQPASIYLVLMNVMPVQFASGKTDGLVCNEILNNTDEAKVTLAVLAVQAKILNGTQISEIDEKLLFDLPQIREDDSAFISLTELRYKFLEAVGRQEDAEKYRLRFEQLKEEYI